MRKHLRVWLHETERFSEKNIEDIVPHIKGVTNFEEEKMFEAKE